MITIGPWLAAAILSLPAQAATWSFAVSGDSRNCGDVVMAAIAPKVRAEGALFFWHLGDFRWMSDADEDIQHAAPQRSRPLSLAQYQKTAWDDFAGNQLAPFGKLPVRLVIGNHELIKPKTRREYIERFGSWLNGERGTYYHWREGPVDFIALDNASEDQFDEAQLKWFEAQLARDSADASIKTIVVAMHAALPGSLAGRHSMERWPAGRQSGRRVYQDLVKARDQAGKRVYVLASHSHYFMDGIFNTDYGRARGAPLSGWIVGTAGAFRYALPANADQARQAQGKVYGYLSGEVAQNGEVAFSFKRVDEGDVPPAVLERYTPDFVHWCFAENAAR